MQYLIQTYILSLTIFLCTTCTSRKHYSPIDDLTTAQDIEAFVHKLNPKNRHFRINQSMYFEHPNCRQIVQALNPKPWYKIDLDQNGYTDLLIHSLWDKTNYVVALMAFKQDQYKLKLLGNEACNCTRPIEKTKTPLLEFFHFNDSLYQKTWSEIMMTSREYNRSPKAISNLDRDTLTYAFGDFIEYNPQIKPKEITAIHFKTISCLGHCPIFELNLKQDQTATYHAIDDHLRKGHFKTRVNKNKFQEIMGLVQYMNVASLKNKYQKGSLQEPTSELTITFKNGKQKKIKDTSYEGTRSLGRLYNLLIDLRKNQQWDRIRMKK